MCKLFTPYVTAKSIYEVDLSFLEKEKIKYLLLDLDNTLDSYKRKTPNEKAYLLKDNLKKRGIMPIIISNNRGKRVRIYAEALGVKYFNTVGKPFIFKLNKILKSENITKTETMVVGDQLITDIAMSNRAKIKSIYVDKLVKEDQLTTRFNRLIEKPIKKILKRKRLLIDWKEKNDGGN